MWIKISLACTDRWSVPVCPALIWSLTKLPFCLLPVLSSISSYFTYLLYFRLSVPSVRVHPDTLAPHQLSPFLLFCLFSDLSLSFLFTITSSTFELSVHPLTFCLLVPFSFSWKSELWVQNSLSIMVLAPVPMFFFLTYCRSLSICIEKGQFSIRIA